MSNYEIEQIKNYCAEISRLAAGPGNNLNEVAETYNYVNKELKQSNLTETVIGKELEQKLTSVANISEQLTACLNQLEKSLDVFCSMQQQNNI